MDIDKWPRQWRNVVIGLWVTDGILLVILVTLIIYKCYRRKTSKRHVSISVGGVKDNNVEVDRGPISVIALKRTDGTVCNGTEVPDQAKGVHVYGTRPSYMQPEPLGPSRYSVRSFQKIMFDF